MKNSKVKLPIGVFDSGIGGISVLAEILKLLSHEEFIYFADTLHSPYGIKPENIVQSLSIKAAEFLSLLGIKSLVIACNTATSAAISNIRKMHTFPVIGMEPAVKLAVDLKPKGKIIVMATPLTLKSKKFNELISHYTHLAEIILMPCAGLVEIIEQDYSDRRKIENYLASLFSSREKKDISVVVLGCTHYILIKEEIMKILGGEIHVIDGNYGTAKQLRTVLQNECLLNNTVIEKPCLPLKAQVKFYISGNGNGVEARCKQLLQQEGIICE
ncbi:MAG: glutamate racemase [Candidatus Jettenia sp.]|uniref:Glutamate racemase n=1 Tax=Candidatus Jettenia caeni TaxID=247490 RepID=I3IKV5_9BACT|nr:glutamate racemase [Candidatus Jettenia sp. AMX1]MBC6929562.1 glutamate racemase [Candidatus Jettenia sp.]WKZ14198.1 MAG: glutamate racemase [Candidatus Jettenia caeni]KAA0247804.1 MAG: glutamate racemase [Candidatus Jettenia sp. AMX1]MCE7881073.1 glutamate racemase [Candidatus Jettenia sp. AMX1]MCQ3927797.1 glutamate racemase [Candidatus Jettenia sp.]